MKFCRSRIIVIICGLFLSCTAPVHKTRGAEETLAVLFANIDRTAEIFSQKIPEGSLIYIAELEGGNDSVSELVRSRLKGYLSPRYSFVSRLKIALLTDVADYLSAFTLDAAQAERVAYKTGAAFVIYGSVRAVQKRLLVSLFAYGANSLLEETWSTSAPRLDGAIDDTLAIYGTDDSEFELSFSTLNEDSLYYDGEALRFSLAAAEDCYVKITRINSKGELSTLFPADSKDDNFLRGLSEERVFPPFSRITLGKPYGSEYLLVAAYKQAFVSTFESGQASRRSVVRTLMAQNALSGEAIAPAATAWVKYRIVP